jgi:DNA polymerase III alpha subunit
VLVAENNEGYHNLLRLVSANLEVILQSRVDKELLATHSKD